MSRQGMMMNRPLENMEGGFGWVLALLVPALMVICLELCQWFDLVSYFQGLILTSYYYFLARFCFRLGRKNVSMWDTKRSWLPHTATTEFWSNE